MAQKLKESILEKINLAALEIFAENGFRDTRLQDIAEKAGISTGNIYRYYKNKVMLFDALVNRAVLDEITSVITLNFTAAHGQEYEGAHQKDGVHDPVKAFPFESYYKMRHEMAIALYGAKGTSVDGFIDVIIDHLVKEGEAYQISIGRGTLTKERRDLLKIIYRNFMIGFSQILSSSGSKKKIQQSVYSYVMYHQFGIFNFLAP